MARSFSAGGQLAMEDADPQPGELGPGQALRLGHHRGGLDPLGPFDQRADHEGPVAVSTSDRTRLHACSACDGRRTHWVATGSRPGGSSSMMVMSRSPKTTMAAVRGMGVAVITRRSGSWPRPSSPRPLARSAARCSTPKRCCSSMTATPREPEGDLVGEEGVGSDEDVDRAVGQAGVDAGPVGRRGLRGEQGHPQRPFARQGGRVGDGQPFDQGPHRRGVLLGQYFGRGHQRPLVTTLHRHQQGGDGHDRLARADVPLEEPVHGERARPGRRAMTAMARRWAPVSSNPNPATNRSTRVGSASSRTMPMADAPGVLLQPVLAQHQGQLQPEELVEGQAATGGLRLVQGGGPVDLVEGRRCGRSARARFGSGRQAADRRRDRPGRGPRPRTG